jgi:hypothetical protein
MRSPGFFRWGEDPISPLLRRSARGLPATLHYPRAKLRVETSQATTDFLRLPRVHCLQAASTVSAPGFAAGLSAGQIATVRACATCAEVYSGARDAMVPGSKRRSRAQSGGAGIKAAEPRRATYGRASRRSTAAAAAGAIEGPSANVAAASGGGRAGRGRGTLRKRGLASSDVRLTTPAPRVLPRRVASRAAAPPLSTQIQMARPWPRAPQPRQGNPAPRPRDAPPDGKQ